MLSLAFFSFKPTEEKIMRFWLFTLFSISSLLTMSVYANSDFISTRPTHYLQTYHDFNGDQHGDFTGDPVIVLEDGSYWKIHPTQTNDFKSWVQTDEVEVQLRTSWYCCKREHKFKLYNRNRDEYIKVMFVGYPTPPLHIDGTDTYLAESYTQAYEVPGLEEGDPSRIRHKQIKKYKKDIRLSDGRVFTVTDPRKFESFRTGAKVYVGANPSSHIKDNFFLIHGTEREAIWTWVE